MTKLTPCDQDQKYVIGLDQPGTDTSAYNKLRLMETFIYQALQPRISLIKLAGVGLTQF